VEWFYPTLVDGRILDRVLTVTEAAAVSSFMRAGILEEIDEQQGLSFIGTDSRPYRWVRTLTTHGVLLPDIDRLWTAWWSLDTPGRATATIQYISCLVYGDEENPVFAPWTQLGGGGPPCLWEFEGHLYVHRWLAPNVAFLRSTLSAARVTEVLRQAWTCWRAAQSMRQRHACSPTRENARLCWRAAAGSCRRFSRKGRSQAPPRNGASRRGNHGHLHRLHSPR
jgi:hypothetical protein